MIEVQKDVPLPAEGQRANTAYPWASMGVGDSFTVPTIRRHATASAASRYAKRHNVAFTSRLEKAADGAKHVRVWRTA